MSNKALFTYPGAKAGIGQNEESIQPASGLRVECARIPLRQAPDFFVNPLTNGANASLANTTGWTTIFPDPNVGLRFDGFFRPIVPCTLSVGYRTQAGDYDQKIQLRITGFDQFGSPRREVTPVITIPDPGATPADNTTWFWCSVCFSEVRLIEYQLSGKGSNDTLSIGWMHQISGKAAPPVNNVVLDAASGLAAAFFNQGFASPFRVRNYNVKSDLDTLPQGKYDILGGLITRVSDGLEIPLTPHLPGPRVVSVGDSNDFMGPHGGFLIGQSSAGAEWNGDQYKILLWEQVSIDFRNLNNWAVTPTLAWNDEWDIDMWVRTSVGGGRGLPDKGYPDTAYSRDPEE